MMMVNQRSVKNIGQQKNQQQQQNNKITQQIFTAYSSISTAMQL
jgi:hypothetical protein